MKKYAALLRGVNVGGNNKISMTELKAAFAEYGFSNVFTYINSGNIIFSSCLGEPELKEQCERIITESFGLRISVMIISANDLRDALKNAPEWWNNDADSKHNAIFVIPPATAESVMEQVGMIKPEYEQVGFFGQVIFWSALVKTFSRTRWSKVVGTSAYDSITIRNANTAKKLADLARD